MLCTMWMKMSVTSADFVSAAKYFHTLFFTLYIVKFAISQFCILYAAR